MGLVHQAYDFGQALCVSYRYAQSIKLAKR